MSRYSKCPDCEMDLGRGGGKNGLAWHNCNYSVVRRKLTARANAAEAELARLKLRLDNQMNVSARLEKILAWSVPPKQVVLRLTSRAEAAEAELAEAKAGRRRAAQQIIEAIGAPGPESIEDTAIRVVAELIKLKLKLTATEAELAELREWAAEQGCEDPTVNVCSECRGTGCPMCMPDGIESIDNCGDCIPCRSRKAGGEV